MGFNIKTVAGRSRLQPRRDPYWEKLEGTIHIGVRKMSEDSDAHWSVRMLDPAGGKRLFKQLGVLTEVPDGERWSEAVKQAREWAAHITVGGVAEAKTVADACDSYVQHLRTGGNGKAARPKAADDAAKRFDRYVLSDALAGVELTKLTPRMLEAWRTKMASRKALRGSRKGKTVQMDQAISPAALNRDLTALRAALNHALAAGWVTSDFAWASKLKPVAGADGRRDVYLDREQRRKFVEAASSKDAALSLFLRVMCALPVRPGALANLKVGDFDARLNQLRINLDKTGARTIVLPAGVAATFSEASRDKLPTAWLFTRADGGQWSKDGWKHGVKAAALAAGLPEATVMYSLRHSVITDLIVGGVDPLTVAQLSGTSLAMIQRHYGQLQQAAATAALAAVAL